MHKPFFLILLFILIYPFYAFASGFDSSEYEFVQAYNDDYYPSQRFDDDDGSYGEVGYSKYKPHVYSAQSNKNHYSQHLGSYMSRLPAQINTYGEKAILVDPNVHAWGAYTADGKLIKAGLVSAGAHYCRDLHRGCRTRAGVFRIYSLGSKHCISHKFPLGKGGAPMPYCMYFNGGQGLHGSYEVVEGNISHGCVRMHVPDAEWIRFNFATIGTKVIVKPY